MINKIKSSKDQVFNAIENGEFDKGVISSKDLVVVVMTQDWCPQWIDMESWIYSIETNKDIDVYELVYNRTEYFNEFMNFKENVWKNSQIPYLRLYQNGKLVGETNYINRERFKIALEL
jgi:hypothetical protein